MADTEVLALCGSLRAKSMNRGLLRAAQGVAPEGMRITIYEGLGDIPAYNADIDTPELEPAQVKRFRDAVRAANGLLFAIAEYNYSVPGFLKNAIDWASRPPATSALKGKPAAIMGASSGIGATMRGQHHLRQMFVFTQTYAMLQPEVQIPKAAERMDADSNLTDESTRELIRKQMVAFAAWIRLDPGSFASR
ncbi:MAG: NAD(P)H-dependent oxidoreductase [Gemmatimonadota bacterium]|nr:NAD(P)H-dependent oxidoreductase [Gemmatimonadota bacterium]